MLHALIVLHRTYRSFPIGARLHTLIRFLTCPFLRILPHIPPSARTSLEIGAGHALFSRLLADRGLRAYAVEPDARKLHRVERVRYVTAYDEAIRGTFDVVAIVDVLYAVPLEQWDALLGRVQQRLASGGTLLIKEMDPEGRLKNGWNRVQEWLSEHILRITLARAFDYETTRAFAARLERHGFTNVRVKKIDFAYPHPHVLYVATRA